MSEQNQISIRVKKFDQSIGTIRVYSLDSDGKYVKPEVKRIRPGESPTVLVVGAAAAITDNAGNEFAAITSDDGQTSKGSEIWPKTFPASVTAELVKGDDGKVTVKISLPTQITLMFGKLDASIGTLRVYAIDEKGNLVKPELKRIKSGESPTVKTSASAVAITDDNGQEFEDSEIWPRLLPTTLNVSLIKKDDGTIDVEAKGNHIAFQFAATSRSGLAVNQSAIQMLQNAVSDESGNGIETYYRESYKVSQFQKTLDPKQLKAEAEKTTLVRRIKGPNVNFGSVMNLNNGLADDTNNAMNLPVVGTGSMTFETDTDLAFPTMLGIQIGSTTASTLLTPVAMSTYFGQLGKEMATNLAKSLWDSASQLFSTGETAAGGEETGIEMVEMSAESAGEGAADAGAVEGELLAAEGAAEVATTMSVVLSVAAFAAIVAVIAVPIVLALIAKKLTSALTIVNLTDDDIYWHLTYVDEGDGNIMPPNSSIPRIWAMVRDEIFDSGFAHAAVSSATLRFINTNELKGIGYVLRLSNNSGDLGILAYDIPFHGDISMAFSFDVDPNNIQGGYYSSVAGQAENKKMTKSWTSSDSKYTVEMANNSIREQTKDLDTGEDAYAFRTVMTIRKNDVDLRPNEYVPGSDSQTLPPPTLRPIPFPAAEKNEKFMALLTTAMTGGKGVQDFFIELGRIKRLMQFVAEGGDETVLIGNDKDGKCMGYALNGGTACAIRVRKADSEYVTVEFGTDKGLHLSILYVIKTESGEAATLNSTDNAAVILAVRDAFFNFSGAFVKIDPTAASDVESALIAADEEGAKQAPLVNLGPITLKTPQITNWGKTITFSVAGFALEKYASTTAAKVAGFASLGIGIGLDVLFAFVGKQIQHSLFIVNDTDLDLSCSLAYTDEGQVVGPQSAVLAGQTGKANAVSVASYSFVNTDNTKGIGYVLSIASEGLPAGCAITMDIPNTGPISSSVSLQDSTLTAEARYAAMAGKNKQLNSSDTRGSYKVELALNSLNEERPDYQNGILGFNYYAVLRLSKSDS